MIAENPVYGTLLASASRSVATTSSAIEVKPGQHLTLFFSITVVSGTGGLTLQVQQQDPTTGTWYTVANDSAARTTVIAFEYQIGAAAARGGGMSNVSALGYQLQLMGPVRINISVGDASAYTYSVTYIVG